MHILHGHIHCDGPVKVEEDHSDKDDDEADKDRVPGDHDASYEDGEADDQAHSADDWVNPLELGSEPHRHAHA